MEGEVNLNSLIGLLKHGFRILSNPKWVFASGFHISVAGLLGIAGFVLASRDGKFGKLSSFQWLPKSQDHHQKLCLVPGLQNLGNNCFLNVILQVLASCSSFQPFLLKAIEECESSVSEDLVDSLPLAIALASLLEDLCVVCEGRVVLSPRRVMLSMAHYIPNFNLTSQQDAAEAFLHLISSLREEYADCYHPNHGSLIEFCASSSRIISPEKLEDINEQERWQQSFVGPFDGILGSILTCQSCSSQISLNFESFHSLPLSPVLNSRANIIIGCSLEDCLKQFTAAEQVENYRCTNCWHIAGIKYLCSIGANETQIDKLRTCTKQDFCDCKRVLCQDKFPWSNKFSRTLKQISIARSPKILCIHLKRVSVDMFGELFKLQGHISFPLILDILPFMTSGVAIKTREEIFQREQAQLSYRKPIPYTNCFNIQNDTKRLNNVCEQTSDASFSKELVLSESEINPCSQDLPKQSNFSQAGGCSTAMQMQSDDQVSMRCQSLSSRRCLYRLVSVVEHFGRAGSGHYTVYRSVGADSCKKEPDAPLEPDSLCWFCISDSEMCRVSEKDVLAAEASLLFYEKIV
ncbi:hypothetical protein UlMin_038044 [Ulmus minor]